MLRDYFHNPFLSETLQAEHLQSLAETHLEKLKTLNPGQQFNQEISATETLLRQCQGQEEDSDENTGLHHQLAVQLYKTLGKLITLFADDPDKLHQFYGDYTPGTRDNAL